MPQPKKPKIVGIYRIRCVASDKLYIGSSANMRMRWNNHIHQLRKDAHHCLHLQRSFNKNGETSFVFEVIEIVADAADLFIREQHWIDACRSQLFNRLPFAGSGRGIVRDPEFGKKVAERMRGNTIRKGKKMPASFSERSSKILIGNQRRRGIPHTDADKKKISDGLKRAYAEGRHVITETMKNHPVGENSPCAKLTNLDAGIIRSSSLRHSVLAEQFKVSPRTIRNIKNGISWKEQKL